MDLGFETIGNATLVVHDRAPVLATDPWIDGPAYFGSWTRTHEIPRAQREAIDACRFVWISHAHPDHLSAESLERLRGKKILLPDHRGARVAEGLREQGFDVTILKDGAWTPLTDRVRVASISDFNQDAMLFVDLDGTLVIDANDATDRGCGAFLVNSVRKAKTAYLLWLTGYGDADMIHFVDESGRAVPPGAARKDAIGPSIAEVTRALGIRWFVPFSSMHQYQRADSVWANEFTTPIEDHAKGFESKSCEILPAFVRVDLARGTVERIDPAPLPVRSIDPKEFGDDWTERLEPAEAQAVERYFRRITHLATFLDFVELSVGGKEHRIALGSGHGRGLRFQTPRRSLVQAVEWEVFDDLFIGNFMKTTLLGSWERSGNAALYPHVSPFIGKYADNGRARTPEELRDYFAEYRKRGFFDLFRSVAAQEARAAIRPYLPGV